MCNRTMLKRTYHTQCHPFASYPRYFSFSNPLPRSNYIVFSSPSDAPVNLEIQNQLIYSQYADTLDSITLHKVSVFTAAENFLPLPTCLAESRDESCRTRL